MIPKASKDEAGCTQEFLWPLKNLQNSEFRKSLKIGWIDDPQGSAPIFDQFDQIVAPFGDRFT